MDSNFIEAQNKVTEVNDEVIKSLFRFDKYIFMITNPIIIDYLNHRFDDSASMVETVHRIKKGIYIKPKCPVCGTLVTWMGKPKHLFTTYCSNPSCCNGSSITKQKKRESLKLHENKAKMLREFGVEHNSQRKEQIEHRKATLMKKYGTTKLYTVPEIAKKIKYTNLTKTGYDSYFKVPEVREKAMRALIETERWGKSKMEKDIYNYFIELGYREVICQYMSKEYLTPCDFYLPSRNMYIEFQGSQYHHKRAYLGTDEDIKEVEYLTQKNIERGLITNKSYTQYAGMINIWTRSDVKRRNYAKNNNIKLFELYCCPNKESLDFQINLLDFAWNIDTYIFDDTIVYKVKDNFEYDIKVDNIEEFRDYMFSYGHNPIYRRKIIQDAMNRLNKKEFELSFSDIIAEMKINS